ncbi:unnamed protein product [Periconia digitata]|uniref:HD/PDEase domain-containing protein n=1 Tax=Periconia digitata TaxID=1303443 RepID=A0A9W4U3H7_9PLEO|nr:unnamed protein product [Periconia digitata]
MWIYLVDIKACGSPLKEIHGASQPPSTYISIVYLHDNRKDHSAIFLHLHIATAAATMAESTNVMKGAGTTKEEIQGKEKQERVMSPARAACGSQATASPSNSNTVCKHETSPIQQPCCSYEPTTAQSTDKEYLFVPSTPVGREAYSLAKSVLHPAILNHSIRVYLYARDIAAARKSVYDTDPVKRDLLFTACILHDIGTADMYNGKCRFEVEGADAAVALLSELGVDEQGKGEVWMAIALHTTRQIVQRMGGMCAIVRTAVEIDFGVTTQLEEIPKVDEYKAKWEAVYGRMDIEKVLGDAVVAQVVENPEKAPNDSWAGVMYKSYLENPGWEGVNKAF